MRRRLVVAVLALLALPACAASFERGVAATVDLGADPGLRVHAGMPRGKTRRFATQVMASIDSSGFFALAGGVSFRAPRGVTPRAGGNFGLAFEDGPNPDCELINGGDDQVCRGGIGPYAEASVGLDVPLSAGGANLSVGLGGNAYLGADETLHARALLLLGITWK